MHQKNTFCGSKERLHTTTPRQFSKIQDKNPFVGPFFNLLLKNFNLTLPKLYLYKALSVGVNCYFCANGNVYFSFRNK